MASLADLSELVGFFSYSRRDDTNSEGALSRLRGRINGELRLQLGRDFRLWQDTAAIPDGALWEEEIRRAIAESVFFIPIVTPSAVTSEHCRFEFQSFLKRETELGRRNLIFPILYVRVAALEREAEWRRDELLSIIGARQYIDWQDFRHRDLKEPEVARKIETFCSNIVATLQQPQVSPGDQQAAEDERRQQAEAAARDKAEQERLGREARDRRRAEDEERARKAAEFAAQARRRTQEQRNAAAAAQPEPSAKPGQERREAARLGVLSGGRARFAVGFGILTGAALLFVLGVIASASMGRIRGDELFSEAIMILYAAIGLMTLRGARAIRWLAIAALSFVALGALALTLIGIFYAQAFLFAGFTATNILAIHVCLRGWTPLQTPLLAKGSSLRDRGILLAFLAYPLWMPCVWFLTNYDWLGLGGSVAVCGLVYALGLVIAAWGARTWGRA